MAEPDNTPPPHRRRPRYSGTHPRRYQERYKELQSEAYPEMVEHLRARGRTPAGSHVPILVDEVIAALQPAPGERVADCTLGHGGHAAAFLDRIAPGGLLVGFDLDAEQLERTRQRLKPGEGVRVSLHHSNFAGLAKALAAEGIDGFDVVFADLGVSSMQLDDPARGFSYKHDGPLDMRMDDRIARSAADWLAEMDEAALAAALAELADEENAAAIAGEIVRRRRTGPLASTLQLCEAVLAAKGLTPADWKRQRDRQPGQPHPAARTFQALRILVNDELGSLRHLLRCLPWCLRPGGRAGILTFHSGEDRLVKHSFRDGLRDGHYAQVSDAVVRASAAERAANPRSRAAKLRWARRAATTEAAGGDSA